ncbi:MAG: hypothetical protein KDA37_00550 [Planctomycetales bacterium]|nr:hypothetical protein [Planctomycetales bacterium]
MLLAEEAAPMEQAPWMQLDPPTRAMLLMTLLGLVLTGLGLILLTMLGARWVRREARSGKPPRAWPKWTAGRAEANGGQPPQTQTSETMHGSVGEGDTRRD